MSWAFQSAGVITGFVLAPALHMTGSIIGRFVADDQDGVFGPAFSSAIISRFDDEGDYGHAVKIGAIASMTLWGTMWGGYNEGESYDIATRWEWTKLSLASGVAAGGLAYLAGVPSVGVFAVGLITDKIARYGLKQAVNAKQAVKKS